MYLVGRVPRSVHLFWSGVTFVCRVACIRGGIVLRVGPASKAASLVLSPTRTAIRVSGLQSGLLYECLVRGHSGGDLVHNVLILEVRSAAARLVPPAISPIRWAQVHNTDISG